MCWQTATIPVEIREPPTVVKTQPSATATSDHLQTATSMPVQVEVHEPSTISIGLPPLNSIVRDPRRWAANKRKPRPPVAEQRTIAANSISSLAERQIAYYEDKLKMERAEHTLRLEHERVEHGLRMQVLEMKVQLYAKKLHKLREE